MRGLLRLAARHGRLCLIAGLVAGLLLPDLARALQPLLPWLVSLLVFVAALRIGPRAAVGSLGDLSGAARLLFVYQIALPLLALGLLGVAGLAATPVALALVLMLAAPSVTGSANFTVLVGRDPALALRLMVLGTIVFPLTVLPVLWLHPALGDTSVLSATVRLIGAIVLATGAAFGLRAVLPEFREEDVEVIDGTSALLLAVMVVGLMSALGPALTQTPGTAALWIAFVFVANLGLQLLAYLSLRPRPGAAAAAIVAGNRNVALFLVALPPEVTAPLLVFIGAYQLPMYLTPIIMRPLYRADRAEDGR